MVTIENRPQLGTLEMGLKDLRSSQLMRVPEFHCMYDAIRHHHKEEKLSRLTGKGQVMIGQGQADTKFYLILAKMLCEVSKTPGNSQETNLNMVYNWYQMNKKQLHSGPRFGKQMKEKPESVVGITRASSKIKGKSHRTSIRLSYAHAPSSLDRSSVVSLGSDINDATWTLSRSPSPDWDMNSYTHTSDEETFEVDHDIVDQYFSESTTKASSLRPSTVSTVKPPQSRITSAGRSKRGNVHKKKSNASVFSSTIKHPISSLVNPHAAVATSSTSKSEDFVASRIHSMINDSGQRVKFRPSTVADIRSAKLDSWKEFQHDQLASQDTLSKMSFLGRSGTPYDLRYVAHDQAEMPELYTEQVLTTVTKAENAGKRSPVKGDPSQLVVSQPLEEFCQTTDGYYPYRQQKYLVRPKSAVSRNSTPGLEPLGRQWGINSESQGRSVQADSKSASNVRLNTLMNVIDDVTSSMTQFREKLGPNPQSGFRQPASPTPLLPHSEVRPSTVPEKTPQAFSSQHRPASSHTAPKPAQNKPMSARNRPWSSQSRPAPTRNRPLSPQKSHGKTLSPSERPKSASFSVLENSRPSENITEISRNRELPQTPSQNFAQGLDWRGKVSPDVVSHKWGKSGLGGHTYVKSLRSKKRSTSPLKRPKTAPTNRSDQESQDQVSELRTSPLPRPSSSVTSQILSPVSRPVSRASIQSSVRRNTPASCSIPHSSHAHQLDQEEVDQMLVISYMGGTSEDRSADWFDYDSELLARLSRYESSDMHVQPSPSMEFISLVTPKSTIIGSVQSEVLDETKEEKPFGDSIVAETVPAKSSDSDTSSVDSNQPCLGEQHEDFSVSYQDETRGLDSVEQGESPVLDRESAEGESSPEIQAGKCEQSADDSSPGPEPVYTSPTFCTPVGNINFRDEIQLHLDEHYIQDSGFHLPIPRQTRSLPVPPGLSAHRADDRHPLTKHLHLNAQIVSNPWKPSWQDVNPKPVLQERKLRKKPITGRVPLSIRKDSDYAIKDSVVNMPLESGSRRSVGRSITSISSGSGVQGIGLGSKSPEELATPPRTAPSIPSNHHGRFGSRTPRGYHAYMSELEHHARKISSPRAFVEKVSQLRFGTEDSDNIKESDCADDISSGILTVCHLPIPAKTPKHDVVTSNQHEGEIKSQCNDSTGFKHGDGETAPTKNLNVTLPVHDHLQRTGLSPPDHRSVEMCTTSVDKVKPQRGGRPIPTELEVSDPAEVTVRVQKQKEARAAVDIQRIFRGYIARNYYKKLQKEERERREDERAACIAIQRAFKRHLNRMKNIYNRPKLDPELQSWAKDYGTMKKISDFERQEKRQQNKREIAQNQIQASAKLSVIGPHVDIYQIYHQKKTGPAMVILNQAAIVIQKYTRGMLVRNKLAALKRKALYHGSNWSRYVQEYRHIVRRVQERHGVIRPVMPFSFSQINEFMDLKRRHEGIFEKKAFGGEIDICDLPQFFKECDLYPSQAEIDDAKDAVIRGGMDSKSQGLHRNEVMEILYHIYPPPAAGLSQHRKSTWMNPIIDGEEAIKLLGSEFVEDAPLSVCVKLVVDSKRERREREAAEKQQEMTGEKSPQLESPSSPDIPKEDSSAEDNTKKVVFLLPEVEKSEDDEDNVTDDDSCPVR